MDFSNNEGVVSAALERDIALQKLSEADATARQTRIAIAEQCSAFARWNRICIPCPSELPPWFATRIIRSFWRK